MPVADPVWSQCVVVWSGGQPLHELFLVSQAGDAVKAKGKGKGRKRKKSGPGEAHLAEDESTPEPMPSAEHGALSNGNAAAQVSSTMTLPTQSANDIVSSNAYMLLYKRRGLEAPSRLSHASNASAPAR